MAAAAALQFLPAIHVFAPRSRPTARCPDAHDRCIWHSIFYRPSARVPMPTSIWFHYDMIIIFGILKLFGIFYYIRTHIYLPRLDVRTMYDVVLVRCTLYVCHSISKILRIARISDDSSWIVCTTQWRLIHKEAHNIRNPNGMNEMFGEQRTEHCICARRFEISVKRRYRVDSICCARFMWLHCLHRVCLC